MAKQKKQPRQRVRASLFTKVLLLVLLVGIGWQLVRIHDQVEAAVAEKAIPGCHVVCITGEEMESAVRGYYQTLFDQNPAAVGGELPEDDYYAP